MIVAKVARSRARVISRSALGTTDTTKLSPSASMSANNGATTVVLPAPMIICFTVDRPASASLLNFSTISTCLGRKKRFQTNSKTRNRGSRPTPLAVARA